MGDCVSMSAEVDREHIFAQYFGSGSGIQFARSQALGGTLQHSPLRSLCWRLFLGIIPEGSDLSTWSSMIKEQRQAYTELKEEHLINPYEDTSENLLSNNPLSQVEDSPWQTFFQNQEMQNEIRQDVIRTYPEKDFFRDEKVQGMMLHILFIVAKRNPNTGYRQGMHELLAPLLYLLHKESVPTDLVQDHVAYQASDAAYIEHDAFTLFDRLMKTMDQFFTRNSDVTPGNSRDGMDNSTSSPVVQKTKKIQDIMLKKLDPILHAHLVDLDIEPQIYMLRWIRLLFGREFHLDDVLTIWDAVFAFGNDFKLIDYMCLTMIMYLKDQLISMDNSGCLRRLFNYPPVEDVTILIHRAQQMADPSTAPQKIKSRPKPRQERTNSDIAALTPNRTPQSPSESNPAERNAALLKQSQMTRVHMASRLERIIYVLQQSIVDDTPMEPETLVVTVAELKQVKDILNGLFDDEPLAS